jgi:hypothetical protein
VGGVHPTRETDDRGWAASPLNAGNVIIRRASRKIHAAGATAYDFSNGTRYPVSNTEIAAIARPCPTGAASMDTVSAMIERLRANLAAARDGTAEVNVEDLKDVLQFFEIVQGRDPLLFHGGFQGGLPNVEDIEE